MRICKKCNLAKPESDYWQRARWKYGACKTCMGNDHRSWSSHNLFLRKRKDAKFRGIKFNLTELPARPERCPILDIIPKHWALDRIDNRKGYVVGNVRWISKRANMLKCDMTLETVKRLLAYMENEHD
jgi:hypothetical protein